MKTNKKKVKQVAKKKKSSFTSRLKSRGRLSKFTAIFFALLVGIAGVYLLRNSFAATTATVSYSGNIGGKGKNSVTSRSYDVSATASGNINASLSFNNRKLSSATLEIKNSTGTSLAKVSQTTSPLVVNQPINPGKYTFIVTGTGSGSFSLTITYPLEEPTTTPPPPPSNTRSSTDRTDDKTGNQIHVIYVLPSDGADRSYDTNGSIALSVNAFNKWLATKTGGQNLRVDTYQGAMDVSFYRLSRSDATIKSYGAYVRDEIEKELKSAGQIKTGKIYAVYYDGSSSFACGGGAWPPDLPGQVAAMYLKAAYSGYNCDTSKFTTSIDSAGYRELAMLHEIVHTLGHVPKCAKNHVSSGHTSEDNRDLMYAGSQAWQPSLVDVNNNDYYKHGISGCPDLANSPYMTY